MVLIRNASFPGSIPGQEPKFTAKPRYSSAPFAELADEIEQTCRQAGITRNAFETEVKYINLCERIRCGMKLHAATEQRIRLALNRLKAGKW